MAIYQLTDWQKKLIRSLVPGLEDGECDLEWVVLHAGNQIYLIQGIDKRGSLWATTWKGVSVADFANFCDVGLFSVSKLDEQDRPIKYLLYKQRIIDAVKTDFGNKESQQEAAQNVGLAKNSKTVFVVHGRNTTLRQQFFDFLRALGLYPLEWEECIKRTGKPSPYIGEILKTAFSEAQAIVVLLTPDDVARLRLPFQQSNDDLHETRLTTQARPNVIFEAGMAFAHNPDRTIFVEIGKTRPFTDISGIIKVNFDGTPKSRLQLKSRLETAKCDTSSASTDWLETGVFDLSSLPLSDSELTQSIATKSGNIWWLYGDMTAAANAIHDGDSDHIEDYLNRCHHHATQIGLPNDIVSKLFALKMVSRGFVPTDWTGERKNLFLTQLTDIRTLVANFMTDNQPGFKPDPSSK